jgi:hypothetical protein
MQQAVPVQASAQAVGEEAGAGRPVRPLQRRPGGRLAVLQPCDEILDEQRVRPIVPLGRRRLVKPAARSEALADLVLEGDLLAVAQL